MIKKTLITVALVITLLTSGAPMTALPTFAGTSTQTTAVQMLSAEQQCKEALQMKKSVIAIKLTKVKATALMNTVKAQYNVATFTITEKAGTSTITVKYSAAVVNQNVGKVSLVLNSKQELYNYIQNNQFKTPQKMVTFVLSTTKAKTDNSMYIVKTAYAKDFRQLIDDIDEAAFTPTEKAYSEEHNNFYFARIPTVDTDRFIGGGSPPVTEKLQLAVGQLPVKLDAQEQAMFNSMAGQTTVDGKCTALVKFVSKQRYWGVRDCTIAFEKTSNVMQCAGIKVYMCIGASVWAQDHVCTAVADEKGNIYMFDTSQYYDGNNSNVELPTNLQEIDHASQW